MSLLIDSWRVSRALISRSSFFLRSLVPRSVSNARQADLKKLHGYGALCKNRWPRHSWRHRFPETHCDTAWRRRVYLVSRCLKKLQLFDGTVESVILTAQCFWTIRSFELIIYGENFGRFFIDQRCFLANSFWPSAVPELINVPSSFSFYRETPTPRSVMNIHVKTATYT